MTRNQILLRATAGVTLCLLTSVLFAQRATPDSVVAAAMRHHPAISAARLDREESEAFRGVTGNLPKTQLSLMRGQYNSNYSRDQNISISQSLPFPTAFVRHRRVNQSRVALAEASERLARNEVALNTRAALNDFLYLKERRKVLLSHDSLMQRFVRVVTLQHNVGEVALMTKTSVETQSHELKNQLFRVESDLMVKAESIRVLCGCTFDDIDGSLSVLPTPGTIAFPQSSPSLQAARARAGMAAAERKLESSRVLPDITIGYFNQTLVGFQNIDGTERYFGSDKRFDGFQVGISLPLFIPAYHSSVRAASLRASAEEERSKAFELDFNVQYREQMSLLEKNKATLAYYNETALANAALLKKHSALAFEKGETDFRTFLLNLQVALRIEEEYIQTVYDYNRNILSLTYLNGDEF